MVILIYKGVYVQELIKITIGENNQQLVSARELHEFLEIKTKYNDWFNRMTSYGFVENMDYIAVTQKKVTAQGNEVEYLDHALRIDMAKEISMIQRTIKGKQARMYFIECEKRLKEVVSKQLPQDYISALKALVEAEEQKALMQPQVEYYKKVLNPIEENGFIKLVTTTAIAKDLGMSAQKLNKILNEKGIIYKRSNCWFLYAEHEDKIPEYADYTINEFGQTLKFTEKGREWIVNMMDDV